jgi:hypothetical protein
MFGNRVLKLMYFFDTVPLEWTSSSYNQKHPRQRHTVVYEFFYTSTLLTLSLYCITGCTSDRPGPLPVLVSNTPIMSVDDLIHARCSNGVDIVVLSFGNINLQKVPEPDDSEDGEVPLLLKRIPSHQELGTTEVFASHEFVSCKKGRKILFTSLTYEMEAKRTFSKGVTTPLELFQIDRMERVKRIFTNDFSTGIKVTTHPTRSTAHLTIRVTPRARASGKPSGIPMADTRRIFSLIGRFTHESCATPWADTYTTRLGPIEAVDDEGTPLKFAKIRDDPFTLDIPCNAN